MLRGNSASRWTRTITALVVALFATVASVRLFLSDPEDLQTSPAIEESDIAGHTADDFVEEPQVVTIAPEPIAITLTIEQPESLTALLEDAGLSSTDAQRWAWFFEKQANTRAAHARAVGDPLVIPETGGLRGLKYAIDDRVQISEVTYGDEVMRTSQEPIKYVLRPVSVFFHMNTDFGHEAIRHAVPQPVVDSLEGAFQDCHPLTELPRGSDVTVDLPGKGQPRRQHARSNRD